jgi:translation initiation factor IF-1
MKKILLLIGVFSCLYACNSNQSNTSNSPTEISQKIDSTKDKEEIENLIKQVLRWDDGDGGIYLLTTPEKEGDFYVGLNLTELKTNIEKLKAPGLFADEFLENYNKIIVTIDKKLRTKEVKWSTGDISPFGFMSEVDPWTLTQGEIPDDSPDWLNNIKVEITTLNDTRAEAAWKYGKPEANMEALEATFSYKFKTVKENGKWKIAYLQGFDYDEATKVYE